MSEMFACPWGCGEMISVERPSADEGVSCPRCSRKCRVKVHEEADGTTWFELTQGAAD